MGCGSADGWLAESRPLAFPLIHVSTCFSDGAGIRLHSLSSRSTSAYRILLNMLPYKEYVPISLNILQVRRDRKHYF